MPSSPLQLPGALVAIGCICGSILHAEPPDTNYDESKVPEYTLPDPLIMADGAAVEDARSWTSVRQSSNLECEFR